MASDGDTARRMLGWGVAATLVSDGDLARDLVLVARPGTGAIDLGCVVGVANLGQDLAFALTTALSADVFDQRFGFDGLAAMAEESEPALIRERLRASVARTVAADPRVRTVTAVEAGVSNASRTVELSVSVDTIAGAGATLTTTIQG